MKKLLLLVIPVVLLSVAGAGLWLKYGRARDPFAHAQELMDKGDLRGAQLELRNSIRSNANNAGAHFRLGTVDLRLGDFVAAEKELKTAREQGYEARLVNPPLAQAYIAQGRYRELLRDFPVQGLPPEQAAVLLTQRALAQLSLGDTQSALASASETERLVPNSADAPMATARILVARNDFDAAQVKVERALQINPRSAEAMIMRGQLSNVKGDRVRAVADFDAALALNPRNLTARLERANLLLMDGKDARAKDDVNAALEIEPRSSMAIYLRAVIEVKTEDYAGADADLNKISGILTRFPRGFFFYAIAKYNLGQAEQASDAANKFLAKNPRDPDAIKLFCRIELAARRPGAVIKLLQEAQKAGSIDSDILELLGRAYTLSGRPQLGLETMERAAALSPDNADILARLAALRLSLGDASRASEEFEKAYALAPDKTAAAEQLVLASISAAELDRAAVALSRLIKAKGESEMTGNLAALLRMAQLDLPGAETQLRATIAAYPESTQPRINLAKVLVLLDRTAEAQVILGEVLDRKPADGVALSMLVALLNADNRGSIAQTRLERAHEAAPRDADISITLANQILRANEGKKALALVDEVLRAQPENAALLAAKGRFLASRGQPEEAEQAYRMALDTNPLDVVVRKAIADLRIGAKDFDGARKILADGVRAEPGHETLMRLMIEVALRTRGLEAALGEADRLARDPANMPNARWLRGDALMAAARFSDAAAAFATDFRADPGTVGLIRLVGAYNAAGRTEQATLLLREWLQRNPTDAGAAEQLASLDIIARRFFEAEKQLGTIIAQRPSDAVALNNLAWVYLQRNDSRARIVAQKSYLLNPTPEAADTLGWILVNTGNPATGYTLLRQAASSLRRDPTVLYHYAVAQRDTGRKEDAIATLRPLLLGLSEFEERPAAQKLLDELLGKK